MLLSLFFETLRTNLLETAWIEFIAVFFGLLSVWFAKQEKILLYPTGIISVVIYVYICFKVQLFADAGINFFYFIMSIYGWYKWSAKTQTSTTKITVCSRRNWLSAFVLFITSWLIILLLLVVFKKGDSEYWSTTVPYIDIFTTAVFVTAMWLLAIKKIENWILWIIGDLISVPLYAYKGLVLTSFQFLVFLVLAVAGYMVWKQKLNKQPHNV